MRQGQIEGQALDSAMQGRDAFLDHDPDLVGSDVQQGTDGAPHDLPDPNARAVASVRRAGSLFVDKADP